MSDTYFGLDQQYTICLKDINERIMKKYGIIEISPGDYEKKETKEKEDDSDAETNRDENENEEDVTLEPW